MNTTLYQAALVMHITGITLMAGVTFIDFITFRSFYATFQADQVKGYVLENVLHKLQKYMGIGMLFILVSGILMMVKLHEVWGAQVWFRIKMVLLLIIIMNGLGLRRMAGSKLKKVIAGKAVTGSIESNLTNIKKLFYSIQLIQILLFILIYVLSVFKFN